MTTVLPRTRLGVVTAAAILADIEASGGELATLPKQLPDRLPDQVTAAELAALAGVNADRISRWATDGRFGRVGTGKVGGKRVTLYDGPAALDFLRRRAAAGSAGEA